MIQPLQPNFTSYAPLYRSINVSLPGVSSAFSPCAQASTIEIDYGTYIPIPEDVGAALGGTSGSMVIYNCRKYSLFVNWMTHQVIVAPIFNIYNFSLPEVLVTVNFTALTEGSMAYVLAGLTNHTSDIFSSTLPVPLEPNSHLQAYVYSNPRKKFTAPKHALLGLVSVSNSNITSEVLVT
jgi:hypothetical protein